MCFGFPGRPTFGSGTGEENLSMVALATSFHPVGCLVLWAHLSCLVLSCLLFSRLSCLVLSSLDIGLFSYWQMRLKDRDRDKDKDRRRGSSTACLLAALRHPLFLSSSFFVYPTPSSLARIAPLSLGLRCPRFTPPSPSVHASVRASVIVVAICL